MFEQDPMGNQPFPASEEEKKQLVSNVIQFVHSEEVSQSMVQVLQSQQDKPIEAIANLGAVATFKVVHSIEQGTGRDIPSETELGVLRIVVEELTTVASNMGFKPTPEKVHNMVQIAAGTFNRLQQEGPQAMQGGPQQGQPQEQPQQALGGMV